MFARPFKRQAEATVENTKDYCVAQKIDMAKFWDGQN